MMEKVFENINDEMITYYAKKSLEFEDTYKRPERQKYINKSKMLLKKYFFRKNVLEISCGTGFWTETISEVSNKIIATDINNEVLDIAKTKKYFCEVKFIRDDSYILEQITEKYDSLFAGFWFSHIPKSKIKYFISIIHEKLKKDAIVVFMDNLYMDKRYLDENSSPISRYDIEGNSYQVRKLKDNSHYEVIKNFYDENSLKECFRNYGKEIKIYKQKYFWIVKYIKR